MGFKQGYYNPRHPEKYMGDPSKIRFMSSWELKTHQFFDNNPNILRWGSEIIPIPYKKPTDKQMHYYYPDYYIEYKNKKGQLIKEIIEVKPAKQTRPSRTKNNKVRLYENVQYTINVAKWKYAVKFCNKYGIKFRLLTEREIFK